MTAFEFATKHNACIEGFQWLEINRDVITMEEAWDTLFANGNRFIFWAHSRCPFLTFRQRIDFFLHIKDYLGEDYLASGADEVDPVVVKDIMKGLDNPYRGKKWEV